MGTARATDARSADLPCCAAGLPGMCAETDCGLSLSARLGSAVAPHAGMRESLGSRYKLGRRGYLPLAEGPGVDPVHTDDACPGDGHTDDTRVDLRGS